MKHSFSITLRKETVFTEQSHETKKVKRNDNQGCQQKICFKMLTKHVYKLTYSAVQFSNISLIYDTLNEKTHMRYD
jgi:hypothetical protein